MDDYTYMHTNRPFSVRLAIIATLDFTKTSVRHVIVTHLTSIMVQLCGQIYGVLFNMMQFEREFFLIYIARNNPEEISVH